MTKKVKDMQRGDVVETGGFGERTVERVFTEDTTTYVLYTDSRWHPYPSGHYFIVKPRMIPASEVKQGMTVRIEGEEERIVVQVVVMGQSDTYLMGYAGSPEHQRWANVGSYYQCEVIA